MLGRLAAAAAILSMTATLAGCVEPRPAQSARAPAQPAYDAPAYVVAIPVPTPRRLPTDNAPRQLTASIQQLVREFPGTAGVAIRAVDEGWTVQSNGRLKLPQQSVSKLWVAMTLLDQRDQGRLRLDDPITLTPADLTLFHQPIANLVKGGSYQTTVGNLLFRALTQSDNTANDRLLTLVGGPSAVREFIERKQLGDIRFGPGERLLQAGTAGLTWNQAMSVGNTFEIMRARLSPETRQAAMRRYIGDPPDGAAPLAIADALARLFRGELLSETSTRLIVSTMESSRTGRARLKAGIAPGWTLAHKTGTGQELGGRNAGFNDVGVITSPDGRRYAVAVMIGDTTQPMRVRQQLIQAVAATVTGYRGAATIATREGDDPEG
ncbi:class A beta-lactamase-related serine hydrolase [Sphingomonas sp. NBWT7]|uniref:class A beta-lactamase-related serine hydrolase n=1 Tax=Sphingomonas sp. NBWT7 TaxID=2596913 RepID=UPI002156004D|nr:class A beta-lactamase-related serine hydrolase [Sphingomonas sp. NBWT7]